MSRHTLQEYLDIATQAVEAAAGVAHQAFSHQTALQTDRQWKEEDDLQAVLTQADLDAETVARKVIAGSFPQHEILGEEFGLTQNISEYRWLIDPIDGSRNFSFGVPMYACGATLLHKNEVLVGCIILPEEEMVMTAAKGMGVQINGKNSSLPDPPDFGRSIVAYNWKNREPASADVFMPARDTLERSVGTTRSYGSALLNVTYLVLGRVHVVLSAHTTPWDMIPGAFFAREAGGTAVDYKGNDWKIGTVGMITGHQAIVEKLIGIVDE